MSTVFSTSDFKRWSPSNQSGWGLFKTQDFTFLWASQALSQVGDGLVKVALLWFVYKLTGSALKMTVIGLLQTIPPLLLSPIIGVYLDRLPKKPVMVCVEMVRSALLIMIPILSAMNSLSLMGLYLLVFLIAVVFTAFGPALSASIPLIVGKPQLTAANALIQSTATMGVILGPVISGPGIAMIGAENMLYVGAPIFVVAAALLLPVQITEPPRARSRSGEGSLMDDMLNGLKYVWWSHAALRFILIVTALHSVVASAFVFLLPVFADQSLNVGPMELGWLWSAYGGGMLLSAGWLTFAKPTSGESRLSIVAVALAAGGLAAGSLALRPALPMALALNGMIGISLGIFTPVTWSLLQEWIPAHLRGRVFAMVNTIAMSSSLVGMMAFGSSAETLGPLVSLLVMGMVLLSTSFACVHLKNHALKNGSPVQAGRPQALFP